MNEFIVPFNQPYLAGSEMDYLQQALEAPLSVGGASFAFRCAAKLKLVTQAHSVLLTHSCTNALELAAMLANIQPGDEVIIPSFTFTSTANAFVLRGARIVFVDIRPDTLNMNEDAIEAAITPKTRVIIPVHYAGIACNMDRIMAIAAEHKLLVVEDAAQSVGATYNGRPLGTLGHLGTYSFHATKNLSCGEGGALLVNDKTLLERAEILHDKGTNRAQFRAGNVRQYEWVDVGMSAPPSELQAACLLAQLERLGLITQQRVALWQHYDYLLGPLSTSGKLRVLLPPSECNHNGHIFAVIFNTSEQRDKAQQALAKEGIQAALHYQPLHLSPEGRRVGTARGSMVESESLPSRLLRLPIWPGMPASTCERVVEILRATLD
ncbi:MAG: dTDP-4-amino-4,6-dideoxygalactose transaminase [Gammaproteobacteria bacterium]|nr:dTDP-4-amino-4,6-dideoxygalactose transaminase [Gammaproteobacteria bacterium]MBQ0774703.1 dTDP-4-amino-4,6-dideoxygalactose transaminase [Gammaproteobacteria bacterium]